MAERITHKALLARLEAQGVKKSGDYAFRCVVCNTVQSMRSLKLAGCPDEHLEGCIGFSCVGRWTNAGPWTLGSLQVGCDWTIGGLFGALGRGIIVEFEGSDCARFDVATPEEAQELERRGGEPFRAADKSEADHG